MGLFVIFNFNRFGYRDYGKWSERSALFRTSVVVLGTVPKGRGFFSVPRGADTPEVPHNGRDGPQKEKGVRRQHTLGARRLFGRQLGRHQPVMSPEAWLVPVLKFLRMRRVTSRREHPGPTAGAAWVPDPVSVSEGSAAAVPPDWPRVPFPHPPGGRLQAPHHRQQVGEDWTLAGPRSSGSTAGLQPCQVGKPHKKRVPGLSFTFLYCIRIS